MSDDTQAILILDAVQDALREFSQVQIRDPELSDLKAKIEQIIKERGNDEQRASEAINHAEFDDRIVAQLQG